MSNKDLEKQIDVLREAVALLQWRVGALMQRADEQAKRIEELEEYGYGWVDKIPGA